MTVKNSVSSFARKMNVIWNATDRIVRRNVTKVLVNAVCNVTVHNIASRFATKVTARWYATGTIVNRNVNLVPANVICNVAANVVSRRAIKVIVHWNAKGNTAGSNVMVIKTAARYSVQMQSTQTSASRLVPPMIKSAR